MVAIDREDRYELGEHPSEASAVAGIVHGFVLMIPAWTLVASVTLVLVVR